MPQWVQLYLGDGLWALMVFLLIGLIFHRKSTWWVTIAALAFSYTIEISQLYHATWIDALRGNRIGGLIFGFGFLWSDFLCYTLGVAFGYAMEKICLEIERVNQDLKHLISAGFGTVRIPDTVEI